MRISKALLFLTPKIKPEQDVNTPEDFRAAARASRRRHLNQSRARCGAAGGACLSRGEVLIRIRESGLVWLEFFGLASARSWAWCVSLGKEERKQSFGSKTHPKCSPTVPGPEVDLQLSQN